MCAAAYQADKGLATADPVEQLKDRLSDPKTAAALHQVLDRLEVFSFLLESLDGFLSRGATITDSLAAGLGELRRFDTDANGVHELIGKLPAMVKTSSKLADLAGEANLNALLASGVVQQLSDPKTLAVLKSLLDRLEIAAFALESLDGFLSRGEVMTDSLASGLAELRKLQPAAGGRDLLKLLTEELPRMTHAANEMIESGMLDPEIVGTLGEIGAVVAAAHREAKRQPPAPVGFFGLLRAMRDPDIQAAVGVGLHIAKRIGQHSLEDQRANKRIRG